MHDERAKEAWFKAIFLGLLSGAAGYSGFGWGEAFLCGLCVTFSVLLALLTAVPG